MKIIILILFITSLVLLPGCSSGSPTTGATTTQTTANTVTISNFSYLPATLNVKAGSTVTWTNKDSVTHTVTSNDNVFNGNLPSGESFSYTFTVFTPGIDIICIAETPFLLHPAQSKQE